MTTRRNSKSIIRNDSALGSFFRSTSGNFQAQYLGNFFKIALPITLFFTFHAGPGYADPKGGVVTAGEGNISVPNETTTQVNQISQNLIVNWESFNVDVHEVVEFNQPNTSAQALNRIFDQNPSQIFGTITAQGRVLLVNPNGVFINETGRVSVGSLIVSGLDVSEPEFMAGNQKFINANGQKGGVVINQGLLEAATGGSVSLIGGAVKNEGVIFANAGQVNLVAGKAVTIDFEGDGLLQFTVDESIIKNAQGLDHAVSNSGTIHADGGSVLLKASVAKDVFTHVVNNSGVIGANKIENHGGVIKLVAGGTSNSLINMGTLDVSSNDGDAGSIEISATDTAVISRQSDIKATSSSGNGGVVHITADRVGLFGTTRVDASGKTGGGEVLIGGDYQGKNPAIKNATETYISSDVSIHADAVLEGDGGKVIVWADDTTRYFGSLSARGGSNQGNGGLAEVSGKENLLFRGKADLSATNGEHGTLLLDPKNIQVADSPNCGSSCDETSGSANNVTTGATFTGNNVVSKNEDFGIRTTDLVSALTGNVILKANNDITIDSAIDASGNNNAGNLELQAGRSIDINANITVEGSFTAIANEASAKAGNRDGGDATFNSNGFTINTADSTASAHNISISYQSGPGSGSTPTGAMVIGTLNAGSSGTITLNPGSSETVSVDAITNASALTLTQSNGTTFEGAVTAGTITLTDTTNNADIVFQGNVTATTLTTASQGYDLSFTGGSTTITNAVTFQNTGTLNLGNGSDTFTFNGGLTESTSGTVTLEGTIASSNDAISFGNVTSGGTFTIDTNATNGTGDIAIGAITAGNVNDTITLKTGNNISGADVTVSGALSGSMNFQLINVGGTATFNNNVNVLSFSTGSTVANVVFNGSSNTFQSAVSFSNDGALTFGNSTSDSSTFNGGLTTTSVGGTVTLEGTIATSNDAIVLGAVTLSDNTTIDTNATNGTGDITIAAITGGSNNLTLSTGNNIAGADVTASGAISGLGNLTLADVGGTATFSNNVAAAALSAANTVANIIFTGSTNTFSAASTLDNDGTLTFGDATGDSFTFNGGLNTASVDGTVTLNTSISSSNDAMVFGAITLGNNVTLDTNASSTTGDLTLGVVTGGSNTLTLSTGNNVANSDITASGNISGVTTLTLADVGGTATLSGDVDVTTLTVGNTVANVAFTGNGSSVANAVAFANDGTLILGASGGTQTYNGGLNTTGANCCGASTVTLNGTIATSNDVITFGSITLGSNVTVDTNATDTTGDIIINGSVTGANNSLTLETTTTTGSANHTFNGDINVGSSTLNVTGTKA